MAHGIPTEEELQRLAAIQQMLRAVPPEQDISQLPLPPVEGVFEPVQAQQEAEEAEEPDRGNPIGRFFRGLARRFDPEAALGAFDPSGFVDRRVEQRRQQEAIAERDARLNRQLENRFAQEQSLRLQARLAQEERAAQAAREQAQRAATLQLGDLGFRLGQISAQEFAGIQRNAIAGAPLTEAQQAALSKVSPLPPALSTAQITGLVAADDPRAASAAQALRQVAEFSRPPARAAARPATKAPDRQFRLKPKDTRDALKALREGTPGQMTAEQVIGEVNALLSAGANPADVSTSLGVLGLSADDKKRVREHLAVISGDEGAQRRMLESRRKELDELIERQRKVGEQLRQGNRANRAAQEIVDEPEVGLLTRFTDLVADLAASQAVERPARRPPPF